MEHIYLNIEGWFNFQKLYTNMVTKAVNGSTFVEVGTWKGRSASYMAVEIANSNKNIDFYCVDLWSGVVAYSLNKDIKSDDKFYTEFTNNISTVSNYIKPLRMPSLEAAASFEDNTIDFIFIDASHDYENVKADLAVWYPKLKSNGVIGGHDYATAAPGVVKAVDEFVLEYKLNLQIISNWWYVDLTTLNE